MPETKLLEPDDQADAALGRLFREYSPKAKGRILGDGRWERRFWCVTTLLAGSLAFNIVLAVLWRWRRG